MLAPQPIADKSAGKQLWLLLVAVAILVAAGWYWYGSKEQGVNTARRSWNAAVGCMDCKAQYAAELTLAMRPPHECEKCHNQAGWPLKRCATCNLLFLPALEGDPPRQPTAPKCPKCGSDREVGGAGPEDLSATGR